MIDALHEILRCAVDCCLIDVCCWTAAFVTIDWTAVHELFRVTVDTLN